MSQIAANSHKLQLTLNNSDCAMIAHRRHFQHQAHLHMSSGRYKLAIPHSLLMYYTTVRCFQLCNTLQRPVSHSTAQQTLTTWIGSNAAINNKCTSQI